PGSAGTPGQFDDIEVGDVRRFEGEMLQWLKRHRKDTHTAVQSSNDLTDEQMEGLKAGLAEFKDLFRQGDTGIHLHEEHAEPMDAGAQTHETVTREVRRPTR